MKTVAIYTRVSTNHQETDIQLHDLSKYAHNRDMMVFKIYRDQISGAKKDRPGLNMLLRDAFERRFDGVLIWKIDRLARSIVDLHSIIGELQGYGIPLVSYKDQFDLSTPNGRLMFNMLGCFAEFERDIIKDRIKAGVEKARRAGKRIGRPAKVSVRENVRAYAEQHPGDSLRKIATLFDVSAASVYRYLKP